MQDIYQKAQSVRLLILDVDGVMTSGTIFYGTQDIDMKGFHIQDGVGIRLLQKVGIEIAVITAKNSAGVTRRLNELEIKHVYAGYSEKLPAYEDIKQKLNLSDQQIAYMGDDLPDLPILKRVHFSVSVPNAALEVKQRVDFITQNSGGQGAVRELCELILKAQEKYESMLQSYLCK